MRRPPRIDEQHPSTGRAQPRRRPRPEYASADDDDVVATSAGARGMRGRQRQRGDAGSGLPSRQMHDHSPAPRSEARQRLTQLHRNGVSRGPAAIACIYHYLWDSHPKFTG